MRAGSEEFPYIDDVLGLFNATFYSAGLQVIPRTQDCLDAALFLRGLGNAYLLTEL